MRVRRIVVSGVVAGTLSVLALGGAAGAKTVTPQRWAASFCNALSDMGEELDGAAATFQTALGSTNLTTAKSTIVSLVQESLDATEDAITALKRAGTPDTTNGKKISKVLIAGFQSGADLFEGALRDAQALPTSDATSFRTAATRIQLTIQQGGEEIQGSFDEIDALDKGGKLGKVIEKEKACAFLF